MHAGQLYSWRIGITVDHEAWNVSHDVTQLMTCKTVAQAVKDLMVKAAGSK
jgi:hypothetical protein